MYLLMIRRISAKVFHYRHCLLCNFLTTLLRPNFDKPVDTVEELVEQGIMVYDMPGAEMWKQLFADSPKEAYRKMAETYYVTKTDEEYHEYHLKMTEEGGLCLLGAYFEKWLWDYGRTHHPQGRGFWKSKETLSEQS